MIVLHQLEMSPFCDKIRRALAWKRIPFQAQGVGRKPEAMVLREVERHLDALAAWLAGKRWLVGSALSLADLAAYAQLHCIDDSAEGHALVVKRPSVVEWMARVADATQG